jgi:hypothetical protein
LNDKDQAIVQLFVDIYKMADHLNFKNTKIEEWWYRWSVAKGQYEAGNNSPEIIKEIKLTTNELMHLKEIGKTRGMTILAHIN